MKKHNLVFFILLAAVVLLSGCNANVYIERYVPEKADKLTRNFITSVRDGDFARATELVNPDFITPELEGQLEDVSGKLNKAELQSVELVKFDNIYRHPFTREIKRSFLFYEVELDNIWFEIQAVVDNDTEKGHLYGFLIEPREASRAVINAFTFSDKSPRQYAILFLAVIIPIFIIYNAVQCLKTTMEKKKSWFLFILFGWGALGVNWTTGEPNWGIMSLSFLGIEPLRDGIHGPWMITVAMPVGALWFFFKRKSLKRNGSLGEEGIEVTYFKKGRGWKGLPKGED